MGRTWIGSRACLLLLCVVLLRSLKTLHFGDCFHISLGTIVLTSYVFISCAVSTIVHAFKGRAPVEATKPWIILLPNAPACINPTHEAASAMLKRLRGGCSVYSELALYHPPNPSPTPFAHRHTLWVCEFKCVLCACLSALSLYVHTRTGKPFLWCAFQFFSLYIHISLIRPVDSDLYIPNTGGVGGHW